MNLLKITEQYGAKAGNATVFTESFEFEIERAENSNCMIITALASFSGNAEPLIKFSLIAQEQKLPFYISHSYCIGNENEYSRKQWRVPPLFLPGMKAVISVEKSQGVSLMLRDFFVDFTSVSRPYIGGLRHNAHLGFYGIAPINTLPALELAAQCGFPACIVVPKVTKDGVLVCIHDDTINRTARDDNGNPPDKDMTVWNYTYDELQEWDYGRHKSIIYKDTKLPLLSDFFDLCAATGMRPMFSTHPGLTLDQWKQVRAMLTDRGLLKCFHIKSFDLDILKTVYSIFGTDIDGYTYDGGNVKAMLSSGIDISKCRVGIELRFNKYTREIAQEIVNAGMFAAAYAVPRTTSAEYRRVINYGVTEFTEDYHCSMGLNW